MSVEEYIPAIPEKLSGANLYHLYIGGGHISELPIFKQLCEGLKRHGIICFPKFDINKPTESILSRIKEGIEKSCKCIILISKSYYLEEDKVYRLQELMELNTKIESYTSDCVLILKFKEIKDIEIPELEGLNSREIQDNDFKDEEILTIIKKFATHEFNPWLSIMSKDSIGYSLALSYFFGFLKIVLPKFRKRFIIAVGSDKICASNLMIIFPESCFSQYDITLKDLVEHTNLFVEKNADRAGTKSRDFKSTIYEFTKNNKKLYCAIEFCTPLLTLYEMYISRISKISEDQMFRERDIFYFIVENILKHPINKDCQNQYKLIFWKNGKDKFIDRDVYAQNFYEFIFPIIENESKYDNTSESKIESDNTNDQNSEEMIPTFQTIEKAIQYRSDKSLEKFDLEADIRGHCLIVNIAEYDEEINGSKCRAGSDIDEENLKNLFSSLKFKITIIKNPTRDQLHCGLVEMAENNQHRNMKAFVWCLMGHGQIDSLKTKDIKDYKFQDIFLLFKCPSLHRKPKLFFIQCCLVFKTLSPAEKEVDKDREYFGLIPTYPDVLVSYSTLVGEESFRTKKGSFYIQALVKCLKEGPRDIEESLKHVTKLVEENLSKETKNQEKSKHTRKLKMKKNQSTQGIHYKNQIPFYIPTEFDEFFSFI